jgi:hypothetical protein
LEVAVSIPLSTTTITVKRIPRDDTRDGYDTQPAAATIASGVRANIGSPSGSENIAAGDRTVVTFRITADPTDLQADDQVTDDTTGATYRCVWARNRIGLGLDHTTGALEQVVGAS